MSMKATIPVPYVIAIVFAVAVLSVVGYWYYNTNISGIKTSNLAICQSLEQIYCQEIEKGSSISWQDFLAQKGVESCSNYVPSCIETQTQEEQNPGLPPLPPDVFPV